MSLSMAIDPVYRTAQGLTGEIRARLATEGNAILATIGDDGAPHLTELLFLLDDRDRVLLPTPHNTRKVKNLRARPLATVFFYEHSGWVSCTGPVEILEGEEAAAANQVNRDRLLTESGHQTIGLVLAAHEDTTIVVTPTQWLSWSSSAITAAIVAEGADLEANPPGAWFKDLEAGDDV
jgi:Pyridoxamine 5'-phosphate oxidase